MATPRTLFHLRTDSSNIFDGSVSGLSICKQRNVKVSPRDEGIALSRGFLDLARSKPLDTLQEFTIEATIVVDSRARQRKNIIDGQTPAIAIFVDAQHRLVGSIHTRRGWVTVNSGDTKITVRRKTPIRFSRNARDKVELRIGRSVVGTKTVRDPIVNVGATGLRIGAWAGDPNRFAFKGQIIDLKIVSGARGLRFESQKRAAATRIERTFKRVTGLSRVSVNLLPDPSHARLQPIKDIMNAAGVDRLSDLQTLRITTPTRLRRGTVIVAPKKAKVAFPDWGSIAGQLKRARSSTKRRELLGKFLTNRNSKKFISNLSTETPRTGTTRLSRTGTRLSPATIRHRGASARLSLNPRIKTARIARPLFEKFKIAGSVWKVADPNLVANLEQKKPVEWPGTSEALMQLFSLTTVPVDSAVIIAQTLDLTNKQLSVDADVGTLYIIAEEIVCGNQASITWHRPGGSTPARASDPDLNGRSFTGQVGNPHGIDGEDGRSGGTGTRGAHGRSAPNLEIWVKNMTAMPNIDLNGEEGIRGGRGQRGGRGGNGGNGKLGKRGWFFGWHCTTDPGDGGDGGDGGRGGNGGRGDDGGHGGRITIGVLEDTLESTVTSRAFRIKNQGGDPGRGDQGGSGGAGGRGGRSGRGETCHDANNGHDGAQGQPGSTGADGIQAGTDGEIEFFEFTEDAWEDLLTRPWLSEVGPDEVFPGDTLILRGSRFSSNDRVVLGTHTIVPTVNADESISAAVPLGITGGQKTVYVHRQDGTESNRQNVSIKPQLNPISGAFSPGTTVQLNGGAFLTGATVLIDGDSQPATVTSPTRLTFQTPGTGGAGTSGGAVAVQVRNPDGRLSNTRTAQIPSILEIPFRYGTHNLTFANFKDGVPSWGTYEDTYGAAEVWHELLDPIFGHPFLTVAFYGFYNYFLKGKTNGGLATGFCTSLAALVADKFWQGRTDTHTVTKASVHEMLTAIHGRLLSRESLIHFHDQSREGVSRVETTYREIESTFLRGVDRNNAPLLFFIPSGAIWDEGYIDGLSDSHCVMPWRFVYPSSHPGPQLSPNGLSSITDPDTVEMYVWDCNHPNSNNCRLVFTNNDGQIDFEYFTGSNTLKFSSQDGITLGVMNNGRYLLSDHDLPFSGPLGLTTFVIDFLLSPADLQVVDADGLRTGNFAGQILSEIPDSHPCYLMKGMYMLPSGEALSRSIVGKGTGQYSFHSVAPSGTSIGIEDVATGAGQIDDLLVNADATQIRFAPDATKTFSMTIARKVGDQARALAVKGLGAGPTSEVDITLSPDLSIVRFGNRGAQRNVTVRAFAVDTVNNTPVNRNVSNVTLPTQHDLTVAVSNWKTVDLDVDTVSFE